MADQKIKVELSADSSQLVHNVKTAADSLHNISHHAETAKEKLNKVANATEDTAQSARALKEGLDTANASLAETANQSAATAAGVSKAEQSIVKAIEQINTAVNKPQKSFDFRKTFTENINQINFYIKTIKLAIAPLEKLYKKELEIADGAKSIGSSAEYFQKLRKVAADCNVDMEQVSKVFATINSTAKKAISDDKGAEQALMRIGIAVKDIQGLSPEQTFERIAGALARMGDTAADNQAKIDVCGDSFMDIAAAVKDLSAASQLGMDGIIKDADISKAEVLKKSFDNISESIQNLAVDAGLTSLLNQLSDAANWLAEGLEAWRKEQKGLLDEERGPLWNNEMVDDENRARAEKIDQEWLEKKQAELDNQYQFQYNQYLAGGQGPMVLPPVRQYATLPKDENGLTPGQAANAWSQENQGGFKSATATTPHTKAELEQKKQELEEQRQREEDERKKREEAANADIDAKIAELKMTSEQKRQRELDQAVEKAVAQFAGTGVSDEKIAEYKALLQAQNTPSAVASEPLAESPKERRLRIQNERLQAQLERMRQRNAQRFARTSQKSDDSIASERKHKHKSKHHSKPQARTEAQPLSTAGSISDPKQARIQRSHELKLAKETAKQKITVKVKNKGTKAGTIAKAITSAVGGLLKTGVNYLQNILSSLNGKRQPAPSPSEPPKQQSPQPQETPRQSEIANTARPATQEALGQWGAGNIDLYDRPRYKNEDGSVSTVASMSFNENGKEVLVPTIDRDDQGNAIRLSDDEAIERYHRTGEYLGKFDSVAESDAYAEKLHKQQEALYAKSDLPIGPRRTDRPQYPFAALHPVSPDTLSAVHQVAQGPLQGQSRQTQTALAQANQSGVQSTDPTKLMSEILTAVKDLKSNTYVVR